MSCPHEERFRINECGMVICRQCGVAMGPSVPRVYHTGFACDNRQPYCRRRRFLRLLANCFGERCPKLSDDLIQLLQGGPPQATPSPQPPVRSTQDIFDRIRKSTNKTCKRYDSLAHLSRCLLHQSVPPLTEGQLYFAKCCFDKLEHAHHHQFMVRGKVTFPAYAWICEKVCLACGRTDLFQYIHRLKCKKRRREYHSLYGHCFSGSRTALLPELVFGNVHQSTRK